MSTNFDDVEHVDFRVFPPYNVTAWLFKCNQVLFCSSVCRCSSPRFLQNLLSPSRSLSRWSSLVGSVTRGAPVDTARISLSATEPTRPKPKACHRYVLSQRKMPQFGCVVASIQTTRLTVTGRTSKPSFFLQHCTNIKTLESQVNLLCVFMLLLHTFSYIVHLSFWISIFLALSFLWETKCCINAECWTIWW